METAPTSTDLAHQRLQAMQRLLAEHTGKCTKCNDGVLTHSDTYHGDETRVERVWKCNRCASSSICSHLPFSQWTETHRHRWLRKAARQAASAANDLLIRCPSCGRESIKPEGTGVTWLGTSSHVDFRCSTKNCPFKPQKTPRSIRGMLVAKMRYIGHVLVVVLSLSVLSLLIPKPDLAAMVNRLFPQPTVVSTTTTSTTGPSQSPYVPPSAASGDTPAGTATASSLNQPTASSTAAHSTTIPRTTAQRHCLPCQDRVGGTCVYSDHPKPECEAEFKAWCLHTESTQPGCAKFRVQQAASAAAKKCIEGDNCSPDR